jgi:tol-pal system protein YbgF
MPKPSLALVLSGFAAFLPVVVGCTHQDPADRSVQKLQADLAKVEADHDRLDQRVGALEAADQRRRETPEPPAGKTAGEPARRLPIVRVGEQDAATLAPSHGEAPDLDTDSADLRPIVRASGSRGSTERRSSKDGGDEAAAFSPEAKRDYEAALALAKGKQFDKALQAFTAFLVRFPDHPYAENAMYWRGECFFATGAFSRAAEQFEGLIARFPYGNKAADALLKLGLSQEKLGAKDQAQKTFAELKDRYPKSDAARQIPRP